jgi:hypothetical protein
VEEEDAAAAGPLVGSAVSLLRAVKEESEDADSVEAVRRRGVEAMRERGDTNNSEEGCQWSKVVAVGGVDAECQ